MPDVDRTADIRVTTAAEGTVTAEIPLAGHASGHWLAIFGLLVKQRRLERRVEAEEREDRAWVIVRLPAASEDQAPELALDAVSAMISEANGMEEQSQSGSAQPRPLSGVGGRASHASRQGRRSS